ncbi:hypothetical protein KP509_02G102500 [Ceratopteris richardii]|nr:hypothetical protein KP509_02G102500 [Ceratopteris richardii]
MRICITKLQYSALPSLHLTYIMIIPLCTMNALSIPSMFMHLCIMHSQMCLCRFTCAGMYTHTCSFIHASLVCFLTDMHNCQGVEHIFHYLLGTQ